MGDIVAPGANVLFMKVGTHADESLDVIIARKRKEIQDAGYALWGYGGNTCHPTTMVQPFARGVSADEGVIHLCMQSMESNHFAVTERATEYSIDGVEWKSIHPSIDVIGSRYALAIDGLEEADLELPLAQTRVAVGNSMGRRGDRYIAGRVDKACLEVTDAVEGGDPSSDPIEIGLVARLVDPYAVFVRNT